MSRNLVDISARGWA